MTCCSVLWSEQPEALGCDTRWPFLATQAARQLQSQSAKGCAACDIPCSPAMPGLWSIATGLPVQWGNPLPACMSARCLGRVACTPRCSPFRGAGCAMPGPCSIAFRLPVQWNNPLSACMSARRVACTSRCSPCSGAALPCPISTAAKLLYRATALFLLSVQHALHAPRTQPVQQNSLPASRTHLCQTPGSSGSGHTMPGLCSAAAGSPCSRATRSACTHFVQCQYSLTRL
jgi:hypothetical protein